MIYNACIIDSITTFLQEAPTLYSVRNFPDDYDVRTLFDKIRECVLIIFLRLVTNKENSFEYISLAEHTNVLYNRFLFTIPLLMDLCQQYGRDNKEIVKKILNYGITQQPLYKEDLKKATEFIIQVKYFIS